MIEAIRQEYNRRFTAEKYQAFLGEIETLYPGTAEFRLAETPVFLPANFKNKMLSVCESVIDLIQSPSFIRNTDDSIPPADRVAGAIGRPQTLLFDYGICLDNNGEAEPKLVEMQGFPSLYGFQHLLGNLYRKHFYIPEHFTEYPDGIDGSTYPELLSQVLIAGEDPREVILLEIKPHGQKTRVDFYYTEDLLGIRPVCITELIRKGKELYYLRDGITTRIKRIYTRFIFDELHARNDLDPYTDILAEADVQWVPHPDWFYRVSKFTLPFIDHPSVPETWFLNDLKQLPGALEDFVLKPLYSFAGQGVNLHPTQKDLLNVTQPEHYILQKKVTYADIITTPTGPAKAEIRMMYLWHPEEDRPKPCINLARISKGEMIGTRFNKDKDWVGGTIAFFER